MLTLIQSINFESVSKPGLLKEVNQAFYDNYLATKMLGFNTQ